MRLFFPIAFFISSCSAVSQKQVETDLLRDAAAAGAGYLAAGKAGAIAAAGAQEVSNIKNLTAAKQPKSVTP